MRDMRVLMLSSSELYRERVCGFGCTGFMQKG